MLFLINIVAACSLSLNVYSKRGSGTGFFLTDIILECYYLHDLIKIEYFYYNILLNEQSNENLFLYGVLYKILIGAKPLRFTFNKVHGFIRDYDGPKNSALFVPEKLDAIFRRVRYLIIIKSGITYNVCYNCAKNQIWSWFWLRFAFKRK